MILSTSTNNSVRNDLKVSSVSSIHKWAASVWGWSSCLSWGGWRACLKCDHPITRPRTSWNEGAGNASNPTALDTRHQQTQTQKADLFKTSAQ